MKSPSPRVQRVDQRGMIRMDGGGDTPFINETQFIKTAVTSTPTAVTKDKDQIIQKNKPKTGNNPPPPPPTQDNKSGQDKKMEEVDAQVVKLYEFHRVLGKGAYGVVWEATEKKSNQIVALKKIFEAFRNVTDSQRTYREVVFLRAFGHHPNIISIIGGHKASNRMDLYLLFPFVKYDLHKLIDRHPEALTPGNTHFMGYQLSLALNYLHSADVIHRDLKPANILVDEKLNVKLADLGLARTILSGEANRDEELTDYVATRWYRPPEILVNSKRYTKAVDMWAFGCILGEMLLKRVLFPGDNADHQLRLVMDTITWPNVDEIASLCEAGDQQYVGIIRSYMQNQSTSITNIFYEFDWTVVDILNKLLQFTPAKRLTIEEILEHPYFESVRDPILEFKAPYPFKLPLSDTQKLSVDQYQDALDLMVDRNELFSMEEFQVPDSLSTTTRNIDSTFIYPHLDDEEQEIDGVIWGESSSPSEDDDEEEEEPEEEYDLEVVDVPEEFTNGFQPKPTTPVNNNFYEYRFHIGKDVGNQAYAQQSTNPMPSRRSQSEEQYHFSHSQKVVPLMKSASTDSAQPQIFSNNSKSILTLPSNKQPNSKKTSIVKNTNESSDIFKKFQLLCEKHDLPVEEFGGDFVVPSASSPVNSKRPVTTTTKSDIIRQQQRPMNLNVARCGTAEMNKSRPSSSSFNKKGAVNPPPSPQEAGSVRSILVMEDNNDCDYAQDFSRIQDTVNKSRNLVASSNAFINPYKPKGLKTDSDNFLSPSHTKTAFRTQQAEAGDRTTKQPKPQTTPVKPLPKFQFNPYSRVCDQTTQKPSTQIQRPYAGPKYKRSFHGPKFKKAGRNSTEITDDPHLQPTVISNRTQSNNQKTSTSAYFPVSSKNPQQIPKTSFFRSSNDNRPNNKNAQMTSNKGDQGRNVYKMGSPSPSLNRSISPTLEATGGNTIRASELVKLRHGFQPAHRTSTAKGGPFLY